MKRKQTAEGRGANKNNSGTHTQISIRLPNELLKRIEDYAKSEGRSRSNAIERLLSRFLNEKGEL